ncbi:hypothetical protein FOMPIDRAFT_1020400 [Fomitopsis schrenkii]|uniref:Uncharacterized protein n=1 Tax=Fomitopsis schrenkii TaxID=2126942 RepID=S8EVY0_FOMSC|nr:hypothetical protein FOMPIDRAFT_1020400 [Fomitopsis schrenkii]
MQDLPHMVSLTRSHAQPIVIAYAIKLWHRVSCSHTLSYMHLSSPCKKHPAAYASLASMGVCAHFPISRQWAPHATHFPHRPHVRQRIHWPPAQPLLSLLPQSHCLCPRICRTLRQSGARTPLALTDKHTPLWLRLAPLQQVENKLQRLLGAASSEAGAADGGEILKFKNIGACCPVRIVCVFFEDVNALLPASEQLSVSLPSS